MHSVKRTIVRTRVAIVASALCLLSGSGLRAQTADTTKSGDQNMEKEDTVVLSPFVVEANEDEGYRATSTLAGTRVRTDLRDVASATSVVTSKFLKDIGATNQQDLLVYTTNTEVGGLWGNFGGMGNQNGISEHTNLLSPNQNTRVRGLDSAQNTRDYFNTDIPWDGYIVDRVDLQRGPNSILFGIGSPAGVVNTSVNTAMFKNAGKFETRIDNFGSLRDVLDINRVLIKNELSFRLVGLDDHTLYRQKPAYNHDRRVFGALRYEPKLFNSDSAHTSIRFNYEAGEVSANRPRTLAPMDKITPFFGGEGKQVYDPYKAWNPPPTGATDTSGYGTVTGGSGTASSTWNPYVDFYMARIGSADPVFWYDGTSGTVLNVQQSNPSVLYGLNSAGAVDASIGGFPFARPVGIAGYNQYAINQNKIDPTTFRGATKNYYKDKSLTDTSIFDFYNKLIDGNNKREWQNWTAYNLSLDQTFLNNKLGFQFVADHQKYRDGQEGITEGDTPYVGIDINSNTVNMPSVYGAAAGAVANPNVGRAYIGGSNHYGNVRRYLTRDSYRLTVEGQLDAEDYLGKGLLGRILGSHVFTGLASREILFNDTRDYVLYATDANWAASQGMSTSISDGARQVDWISYLSSDLRGRSSASGAGVSNIKAQLVPSSGPVTFYNSNWKWPTNSSAATYVNPGAAWTNPTSGTVTTQSENPANYIGWTTTNVKILSADGGDIDQLYTDASKIKKTVDSTGFTWQGHMFDDILVPTIGWRRDSQKTQAAIAPLGQYNVASMNYGFDNTAAQYSNIISKGTETSMGAVLHLPKNLKEKLPFGMDVSLSYFHGTNQSPDIRYGFTGSLLDAKSGKSDEYGIAISALDEKITLKINKYKTYGYNFDLGGDPATSTLGSNTYYLYLLQAWGTAGAVVDALGIQGKVPGNDWYWNWANVTGGYPNSYDNNEQNDPLFASNPETIKEKAAIANWAATSLPQSWFDAYGLPVNVANLKAGNYANVIGNGWAPSNGVGSVQAAGAGKINGVNPVGTIDEVSQGYEFELTAKPIKNLDITVNASKTNAYRSHLSSEISTFIVQQYNRFQGAAGDIRLWWAGDNNIRTYYTQNIWAAYQFQQQSDGASAAELRPWHYNVITNYTFDRGLLKGSNVGFAFRYDDAAILGYGLTNVTDSAGNITDTIMDINKPIHGKSESNLDGWVGYGKRLTGKIDWRIQLNVRNIGQKVRLVPVSVEPDGSPAAQRIAEGMTWQLSNTFSF